MLAESPNHRGLLLAAASGFTEYAYAYVQPEADETAATSVGRSATIKARARRLYLRARNYGMRGLDARHSGFGRRLAADPADAVRTAQKADVPLLYWTAAAWGAAIAVSKDDLDLVADQRIVEAARQPLLHYVSAEDHGWSFALYDGSQVVSGYRCEWDDDIRFDEAFRSDIVVNGKVIAELKSVEALLPVHAKQVLTQLRLSGLKLGRLINFGEAHLKNGIKRIINGRLDEESFSEFSL